MRKIKSLKSIKIKKYNKKNCKQQLKVSVLIKTSIYKFQDNMDNGYT